MHTYSTTSPDEIALRQEIAKTDFDRPDTTPLAIYADWLDENGRNGRGYRLLCQCIGTGAVLTALRVTAKWEDGISPQSLAATIADLHGVLAADGGEVKFLCGPAASKAVQDNPQVDKFDKYIALSAIRLPAHLQTDDCKDVLSKGAFNTATLDGGPLYVYLNQIFWSRHWAAFLSQQWLSKTLRKPLFS